MLSSGQMEQLNGIQYQLCLTSINLIASISDHENSYRCESCEGSCEGDCSGSCDHNCSGSEYDDEGEYD